jgi:HSP20 family molecular chaperone IbpA
MTESTRNQERYVAPPVDIYETQDGLVVLADLPGVAKEALDVRVDNHVLTIRGHARHGVPGEAVYREYELINFFRQFELSDKVDQSQITADLKCGVLTLHLPKAQEAKPRQIEVKVA